MKRVLFVDDEPMVLTALRRMLHRHAGGWEKVFVDSGEAALAALEDAPFDVLVTDMRMPGMDGATLLKHVHTRFPGVIRIVLSGQVDQEVALRITPISHQFLSKPCDVKVLLDVLERACALQQLVSDPAIRLIVGDVTDLPARPQIYSELVGVLADPAATLPQVAEIIDRDLAIASKILHIVNSAFFSQVRRIATIREAVTRLGVNRIKFLTLTVEVFHAHQGPTPKGFSLDRLFDHTIQVARTAMQLMSHDRRKAEDAFLCGLLHDVGMLVLLSRSPEYLTELIGEQLRTDRQLFEIEMERKNTSHAEIGAYLMGLWGFPYPMMDAVANHHQVDRNRGTGLEVSSAVLLANLLATEQEGRQAAEIDEQLLADLGIALDRSGLDRLAGVDPPP